MIDLLLINPNEHAEEIVHALSAYKVSYLVITTNGNMFAYPAHINVLNLNNNPWPKEEKFKSAIAWGWKGQQFLNGITKLGQVVMSNNLGSANGRLLVDPVNEELSTVFSFVSLDGYHAVVDAFVYKNDSWNVFKDHSLKFYKDRLSRSIDFLNESNIQHGPSKVFITPGGQTYLQLSYKTTKASKRKFVDVWPALLASNYPTVDFAIWINETGNSNLEFHLATG